ncbi:MAG: NADH-quinone oxidoreductase subunit C [Deltaproteobacteria bacterium]|nr:NADH-quinone oxidoreductase subunit C [Deltaproteobacteria bacterium]
MAQQVLDRLKSHFQGGELEDTGSQHGNEWARVRRQDWHAVCQFLRDDGETTMDFFIDITAVDRLTQVPEDRPRFDVVIHLRSSRTKHRVRLLVGVSEADPTVDSLCDLWAGANWFERETFDMYGIRFNNHPDLRRILMYPEFIGHPLRKDYPKEKRQPLVRRDGAADGGGWK